MARIQSWYQLIFGGFSFNFECGKLCYFLQAERCILSILFKLIVQWQNEKFYFIILVMAYKALKEAQNELESWSQMILFSVSDQIVYLLSKYNKLTFECQTMKQVAWYFVGMEEEINNKGKKISASTCISHFLSFEVVSAPKSYSLNNFCPPL